MNTEILTQLTDLMAARQRDLPGGSYTTSLFEGGLDRILKKVGEEAGEVIIAAKNRDRTEVANETADLIFHLLIMLQEQGLTLEDVLCVLRSRYSSD